MSIVSRRHLVQINLQELSEIVTATIILEFDGKIISIDTLSRLCHVLYEQAIFILKIFCLEYIFLVIMFLLILIAPTFAAILTTHHRIPHWRRESLISVLTFVHRSACLYCSFFLALWKMIGALIDTVLVCFACNILRPPKFHRRSFVVGTLIDIIAVLCHITNGQPTRYTEITSSTICNNSNGDLEGILQIHKKKRNKNQQIKFIVPKIII